jgi:hypothetical protein
MYSNFVTPPDIIKSILIVDATEEQIQSCADACRVSESAYNVYFYQNGMAQPEWLEQVLRLSDVVLKNIDSTLEVDATWYFGEGQDLASPAAYFDK